MNIRETIEYLEFGYKIIKCPVCGNETLDNHFVCPTCNWEYDGIEDENTWSNTNGYPIQEYRILHGWNI